MKKLLAFLAVLFCSFVLVACNKSEISNPDDLGVIEAIEFRKSEIGVVAHITFAPMDWDSFTDAQRIAVINNSGRYVMAKGNEQEIEYVDIYGEYSDGTVLFHGTGNGFSTYSGNDFEEKGYGAAHYLDVE